MIFIRPYLLLFAETGIEEYECKYHNNIQSRFMSYFSIFMNCTPYGPFVLHTGPFVLSKMVHEYIG